MVALRFYGVNLEPDQSGPLSVYQMPTEHITWPKFHMVVFPVEWELAPDRLSVNSTRWTMPVRSSLSRGPKVKRSRSLFGIMASSLYAGLLTRMIPSISASPLMATTHGYSIRLSKLYCANHESGCELNHGAWRGSCGLLEVNGGLPVRWSRSTTSVTMHFFLPSRSFVTSTRIQPRI